MPSQLSDVEREALRRFHERSPGLPDDAARKTMLYAHLRLGVAVENMIAAFRRGMRR